MSFQREDSVQIYLYKTRICDLQNLCEMQLIFKNLLNYWFPIIFPSYYSDILSLQRYRVYRRDSSVGGVSSNFRQFSEKRVIACARALRSALCSRDVDRFVWKLTIMPHVGACCEVRWAADSCRSLSEAMHEAHETCKSSSSWKSCLRTFLYRRLLPNFLHT